MKRTNKKVMVANGMTSFVRTVYKDAYGRDCFKHNGEVCIIYRKENGRYNAPWFNGVEYIAE